MIMFTTASAMQSLLDVCYEYGMIMIFYLTLLNPYALFSNQRVINCIFQLFLLAKKL